MNQDIKQIMLRLNFHNKYTYEHSIRTGDLAKQIALTMGLPEDQVRLAQNAGYLHDIGKLDIPTSVLDSPCKLSAAQQEDVKKHPINGAVLLLMDNYSSEYAKVALLHHIRYDGSGYPEMARGKQTQISLIVGFADAVDSMMTNRPYRAALPVCKVIQEIEAGKGHQFDPKVADTFLSWIMGKQNVA